jgi:hypothetical protein
MQLPALQQELKQLQEHQQQLEKDRGVQVQVRPVASSAA